MRAQRVRSSLAGWLRGGLAALMLVALVAVVGGLRPVAAANPETGPGGPILVVTNGKQDFGAFYAEILRTEGLGHFAVTDISALTETALARHRLVILAKTSVTSAQASLLQDWVNAGGRLVAMAPAEPLHALLGIAPAGGTLSNAYLKVDTASAPGEGIAAQTLQFHGAATRFELAGAAAVATLYSTATQATTHPAVTLRSVGSGQAAAFAFDLATSVVQARQGNPAWQAQDRDGLAPIRSNDLFHGAAAGDPQADWVDLGKVAIPQADEQQRLLANLIVHMTLDALPMPRLWYFPKGKKAVVIMTGDDHGNGGTVGRFDRFKALSAPGCSVADWECVRGTSYIYASTPLTDGQAATYEAEGFEVGIHITTWCDNYTPAGLRQLYAEQLAQWRSKYSSLAAPRTQRHHCIAWSDWVTGAQVELENGMRLDTNYYFWPPGWVQNQPGLFTSSAMPMRFMALSGDMVDVYQAATQMTDESGQSYPLTIETLLDRALGVEGYFGAFTVNAHTDSPQSVEAEAVVAAAQARGVPIVSARQMLEWLDARNDSGYTALSWNGATLAFTVTRAAKALGLQGMLPYRTAAGVLTSVNRSGVAVPFTVGTVKGREYGFFAADTGSYSAAYAPDTVAPGIASTSPSAGASNVAVDVKVRATFNEAMDALTITGATVVLRAPGGAAVAATVAYDSGTRTVTLSPSSSLANGTVYTATVAGGSAEPRVRDIAGNAMASTFTWSFTTAAAVPAPTCPCSAWTTDTVPSTPSVADPNPVELGVKFTVDVPGYITGIRFYKGSANTGRHAGTLWSANGTPLATAVFQTETASGWQQVEFASPVAVQPNVVYVASYFAPNGGYAAQNDFFATSGFDNGPVNLLRDGAQGGNGVYRYTSSSAFPSSTYRSTNYWVDVVFVTTLAPDTTAPTVAGTTPANGATGISPAAAVQAVFSEGIDPASLTTQTFQLRNAAQSLVPATVTYDAASATATLTPSALLASGATYTATLAGGTSTNDPTVRDMSGNRLASSVSWSFTTGTLSGPCGNPSNPIVAENCLPGQPRSEWDVVGAGDPALQGFATDISVNRGGNIGFKVDTSATGYRVDIYRLGYYGGQGARKVATVAPTFVGRQPACLTQASTGLIDCGNWSLSASWSVPASAVSGVYLARLVRTDGTSGASHIAFVVRDDAATGTLVYQTSDTTWQAYNEYGGNSLYTGSPAGRAYKVSYNRPFNTRGVDNGQDWLFHSEYPMIRWLEANGYDLRYITGVDSHRNGTFLRSQRAFLSVGHDEYWSRGQRTNVEAARDAGVHLAFFSGNEVFWKTRWEDAIDGSGTPYRTLVCYKETHANADIDPSSEATGTWRDPRFGTDAGRPENALTGTLFMVNAGATTAIQVPAADGKMRLWRNTSVATQTSGSVTLAPFTLGYEWDVDALNAVRPPGLVRMSTTTVSGAPVLQDFGSTYASGTATHHLTLYRHASGALVFGAGTVQWSWGLDTTHDNSGGTQVDVRMQQATVNLLADMGLQPATLQPGLVAATASTDSSPPTATISSPAAGSTVATSSTVTISGTAADTAGVVGAVEVSVDGGASWRPATGRSNWTYAWSTPSTGGTVTLRARAIDDSGNYSSAGTAVTVTVAAPVDTTPPTVTAVSPANNATGVARTPNVTATFSEPMDPASIRSDTFVLRLASTGTPVQATVAYDATTRRATLRPTVARANTRYQAQVLGSSSGGPAVRDVAGNAMVTTRTWSFTTR